MDRKGQGLVEYLILVCLIAVSSIAVVTLVATNIKEQYASVSAALRGKKGTALSSPDAEDTKRRDFGNFNSQSTGSGGWNW